MERQEALDLCAYDDWANGKTIAALEALSPDALVRNVGSSFPTIRGTLAHLVGAEWVWHERWSGNSPLAGPPWYKAGEMPELVAVLADVSTRRKAFLEALPEGALARPVAFQFLDGRPGEFLLADLVRHVMNHSTYHRGQLVTMVRQAGGEVSATDFIAWRDPARQ